MAKMERVLHEDFTGLLQRIEQGILNSSASASLEDGSDFVGDGCRCSVRVFERYSAMGSNRVSMSVTLFQEPVTAPLLAGCVSFSPERSRIVRFVLSLRREPSGSRSSIGSGGSGTGRIPACRRMARENPGPSTRRNARIFRALEMACGP